MPDRGHLFAGDKADYSIGLWVGVLTAIFMAFHMAVTINSAVGKRCKGGAGGSDKTEYYPLSVVVIILGILMITRVGNPLAAFAGIMGLKNFRIFTTAASETVTSKRKKQDGVCKN